jgi:hypothetical protein
MDAKTEEPRAAHDVLAEFYAAQRYLLARR